jgi:hypothetical protein
MREKFTENHGKMRVKFWVNRAYIQGKFVKKHRKMQEASAENRGKVWPVVIERTFPSSLCEIIIFSVHLFKRPVASSFKSLTNDLNSPENMISSGR